MSLLLGLDLGGTNIKAAVLDGCRSEIVATDSAPTHADEGPEAVTRRLADLGRSLAEQHDVEALGLAVPGLFDFETGEVVFFTNLPGAWERFPLRSRMAAELGLPVTLINDARAFTLAEGTIGAGAGCDTVVCLTLGTGIGGGVMIGGRLHFGAFGIGGELGHQTLDPDGPVCGCGNAGCLEAFARTSAVAERAGTATFEEAMEGYLAGEERPTEAIHHAARYLGAGIGNLVTILGPEKVVLGGGAAAAGPPLFDLVRREVLTHVKLVPSEFVEIVPAELGSTAGAAGAALASQGSPAGDLRFLQGEVPSAVERRSEL